MLNYTDELDEELH